MIQLLLTPKWVQGESWGGYILRLAEENRLGGFLSVCKPLQLTPERMLVTSPTELLPNLGVRHDLTDIPSTDPVSGGRAFPWKAGRSKYASVCGRCLAEDQKPFLRAAWDSPLTLVCARHGTALQRRCPRCTLPITHFRSSVTHCRCGADFRLVRPAALIDELQKVRRVLDPHGTPTVQTFAAVAEEQRAKIALLRRLARAFVRLHEGAGRIGRVRLTDCWITDVELMRASAWFEDWPTSFDRLYTRLILEPRHRADAPSNTMLRGLSDVPQVHSAAVDVVRRMRRTPRPKRPTVTATQAHVGIKAAMQLCQVDHQTVLDWIDAGLLGHVESSVEKRGTVRQIPREAVMAAAKLVHSTASQAVIGAEVGLSHSAVHALTLAGVLPAIKLKRSTYTARVRPADVYALVKGLQAAALRRMSTKKSTESLSEALVLSGRVNRALPALFIADLLNGHVSLYITDASEIHGLNSARVKTDELRRWSAVQRKRRGRKGNNEGVLPSC